MFETRAIQDECQLVRNGHVAKDPYSYELDEASWPFGSRLPALESGCMRCQQLRRKIRLLCNVGRVCLRGEYSQCGVSDSP